MHLRLHASSPRLPCSPETPVVIFTIDASRSASNCTCISLRIWHRSSRNWIKSRMLRRPYSSRRMTLWGKGHWKSVLQLCKSNMFCWYCPRKSATISERHLNLYLFLNHDWLTRSQNAAMLSLWSNLRKSMSDTARRYSLCMNLYPSLSLWFIYMVSVWSRFKNYYWNGGAESPQPLGGSNRMSPLLVMKLERKLSCLRVSWVNSEQMR